ncbi:MAG: hypothetical protein CO032_02130 [Nitrosopumilales archaeon CG_4_9_14_0_2_um_filter_34_16]|nr:MAG: hypothetical protein CO032_02130 [Nitrosopumilales archaeon CG_4_9_14_0_2_um_filter_34_16]
MPPYYFDIETTGLDPQNDQIITIQYQKIGLASGRVEGPLIMLKSWKDPKGEQGIIEKIIPIIMSSNPFAFVPIGNNLNFEFNFLANKINQYRNLEINSGYFHNRPHIDLKPIMILLNGGRFKGYHLILNKAGSGAMVPKWYKNKEYEKIMEYVLDETLCFTSFYTKLNHLVFNEELKQIAFKPNRRIDDFV